MKKLNNYFGIANGLILFTIATLLNAAILSATTELPFYVTLPAVGLMFVLAAIGSSSIGKAFEGVGQVGARLIFENALETLKSLRSPDGLPYDVASAVPTTSYIRSEVLCEAGKSSYNMPLITSQNTGPVRVLNKLITLQDIFIANRIAMFFTIGAASASNLRPYTYGNVVAFATANTASSLWSFYNGEMVLINNNQQVAPAWPLIHHYKAPVTQAVPDLYYDGAAAAINQDSMALDTDSFVACEPGLVINGAANMQMTINCKGGPAAVETTQNLVIFMDGILFQNVTTVK